MMFLVSLATGRGAVLVANCDGSEGSPVAPAPRNAAGLFPAGPSAFDPRCARMARGDVGLCMFGSAYVAWSSPKCVFWALWFKTVCGGTFVVGRVPTEGVTRTPPVL